MRSYLKLLAALLLSVSLLMMLAINLAQAEETAQDITLIELDQEQLDQMLAPIALYPDTLLSHILVAATYPLEVIEAHRWRQSNKGLTEDMAREAVEEFDWDPSIKALVPFTDLLSQMSDDLDWLQGLGDAFLANEEQVLASIQYLRQKAYENGNLQDNEYVNVEQEDEQIIIETVRKEVVYVPYYDTRVVYGPWWHVRAPFYWHHPGHFVWHAGFYWSPRILISPRFYFGGFHWHHRYVVINHHYPRTWHSHSVHHRHHKRVYSRDYQRWQHNAVHRRGVRYSYATHPRVTTKIVRSSDSGGGHSVVRHQIPHKTVVASTQRQKAQNVQRNLQQAKPVYRSGPRQPVAREVNNASPRHSRDVQSANRQRQVNQPKQLDRQPNKQRNVTPPRQVQNLTSPSRQYRQPKVDRERRVAPPSTPHRYSAPKQHAPRQAAPSQRAPKQNATRQYRNNSSSTSSHRSGKSSRAQTHGAKQKQR